MPKYSTYCNVPVDDTAAEGGKRPCGMEICLTSGLPAQRIGDDTEPKGRAFASAIIQHTAKHHQGHLNFVMGFSAQLIAFMLIGHCETQDPGALQFSKDFAEQLQKLCTFPITDDGIEELSGQLGYEIGPDRQKFIAGVKYVRDFQLRKIALPQSVPQAVSSHSR